jgi:two-component system, chemotaxis family, sensor kinase Cph1
VYWHSRNCPQRWTLYANAAGNSCILELEHDADPSAITRALASLHHNVRAAVRAVQAATCLQQLVDETVLQVRTITGFDRVMVYRFTEEWHGNVVAEPSVPI